MSQPPPVLWIQMGLHSGLDLVVPFREHGCDITNLLFDSAELHHFTQQLPGPIYALFTLHECYSQESGHPVMWSSFPHNAHPPLCDAIGETRSPHTHHPLLASIPNTPSDGKYMRFHAGSRTRRLNLVLACRRCAYEERSLWLTPPIQSPLVDAFTTAKGSLEQGLLIPKDIYLPIRWNTVPIHLTIVPPPTNSIYHIIRNTFSFWCKWKERINNFASTLIKIHQTVCKNELACDRVGNSCPTGF